jgi:hypothetical protein
LVIVVDPMNYTKYFDGEVWWFFIGCSVVIINICCFCFVDPMGPSDGGMDINSHFTPIRKAGMSCSNITVCNGWDIPIGDQYYLVIPR